MNQFTKRGFIVTAVHVGVVSLALVSTQLSRLFMREQKIRPIAFTVAIPDLGQTQQKDTQTSTPEPAPVQTKEEPPKDPTPEPKPEPKKDPTPTVTVVEEKPVWKPAPSSAIKIGPVVKKNKSNLPPPTTSEKSTLSEKEIQRLLDLGARPDTVTSVPEGDALFMAIIQNAFEGAWDEPSAAVADGRCVDTEIKFSTDGRVLSGRVTKGSGVAELDQSVEAALASVSRVSGVPSTFFEYHKGRITIRFRVKE